MTPFKFGKKKNKEVGDAFSSPSSKHNNGNKQNSPQTSTYSNSSYQGMGRDMQQHGAPGSTPASLRQESQGSLNSPQYHPSPGTQQQYAAQPQKFQQHQVPQQGAAIGYDQNNNMYNQKSPQRQTQQQPQYGYSSPQSINGPPPRFQQPQQQQRQSPVKQQATPWSRSKLLISPFPRYRHAASQYSNDKGEVFVMGGLHNTSVYGDTWIIKPDGDSKAFQTVQVDVYDNSPAPRVGHAATTCGNAFVVFGGDTVTNDEGEIDNDLYLFNMNSHTWTIPHPVGRKPSGRYGHSIGVIAITNFDSKVYLYGGQLDDTIYSDLAVFNLSSFRRPDVAWEWVTPADSVRAPPLTNHTMDVYDNKLWLFGGSNGKSLNNDLWSYDPQTNKWNKHKTFGAIPTPCEEHASVIYKDTLIVYGGKDAYGEALGDLSLLNLITKTWYKLPSNLLGNPRGKYGHSLSILKGDRLLILGGHLPDYAQMGDNLEPSMDDNGVGTLLNTLDLTNLEKIIPGYQQYRTPGNLREQERFQGPQSIFTPPQATQQSPQTQKDVATSPEPYQSGPIASSSQSNTTLVTPGGSIPNDNVAAPTAAAGVAAATGAAAAIAGGASSSPFNAPEKSSIQSVGRGMSAEDVFQRERQAEAFERKTPQKIPQRQQSIGSQRTPSSTRGRAPEQEDPSAEEEDLPLQIPSPVRSAHKTAIPAPLPKDNANRPQTDASKTDAASRGGVLPHAEFDSTTPSPDLVTPIKTQAPELPNTSTLDDHDRSRDITQGMPGAFEVEPPLKDQESIADDFLTPTASPDKAGREPQLSAPNQPYSSADQKRDSDFLDNYVNGNSTPELVDRSQTNLQEFDGSREYSQPAGDQTVATSIDQPPSSSNTGVIGTGAAVIAGGVAAVGAAAAGVVGASSHSSSSKKSTIPPPASNLTNTEVESPADATDIARSARHVSADEKAEFKNTIDSLSKELQNLKMTTTDQIKSASAKVQTLEAENEKLRKEVETSAAATRDLPSQESESEIKRKHIKLNTDYQLLNQEHEKIKSKHSEMESMFSSNLFDLQKLNNIIKQQSQKLEEQQKELEESRGLKQQVEELKLKYDSLSKEHESTRELASKPFYESHDEIKKLNTGLDSFLAQYLATDESTGEVKTRSLGGSSSADEGVTAQLRSQIDELLKENEEHDLNRKKLQDELATYKTTQSELEALKAKVAEMSKLEENYKESLHSVNTATRALRVSQSDLAKEKELTSKLQHEIDELKLFRAKKSSRNATPIMQQQDLNTKDVEDGDDEDEDVANAHYNLKIRDLQAELYIIKKERDDLKDEALTLKKKLYNASNPSGSF